jgi:hypothetical protein
LLVLYERRIVLVYADFSGRGRAMKLAACFAISASLLGVMAAAQSKSTSEICPVSMRALQGTGHGLVAVRDDHKVPPTECPLDRVGTSANCPSSSQRIHLILVNPATKRYASARVFVRGLTPEGRIEHADFFVNGLSESSATHQVTKVSSSEISKTLEVRFAPEDEKSMSADLVLPGFSSVTFVQLKSVTYQDGSSWKVDGQAEQACRVAPDPLMLIAGDRN